MNGLDCFLKKSDFTSNKMSQTKINTSGKVGTGMLTTRMFFAAECKQETSFKYESYSLQMVNIHRKKNYICFHVADSVFINPI